MPTAQLGGMQMHYVLLGPTQVGGPHADVVLVHGLAANVACWYWTIAPALARTHRVLLVDLRGHGLSSMPPSGYTARAMADDLDEQLERLQMMSVHLVGHSFGGRVAIQLANRHPARVRSLTLADVLIQPVEGTGGANTRIPWASYRPLFQRRGIRLDEWGEPTLALLEGLARLRLSTDDHQAREDAIIGGPFSGHSGRRSAAQWLRLLQQTTARVDIPNNDGLTPGGLSRLRLPVLLVYGAYSPAMPTAVALHRLWPHARLEVVPESGHFFPITRPDRLLRPLEPFLDWQAHASQTPTEAHG